MAGMAAKEELTLEEFLARHPGVRPAYERVCALLDAHGSYDVRATRSQIAFRRRRGFAFLWVPGMYLKDPQAEVVLSFGLARRDASPRFKEVAHPSPKQWMHHLELRDVDDIDDEVAAWLYEAADAAG